MDQPLRIRSKMGVPELESGTSSLSATRSNQLSYTPSRVAVECTKRRVEVKGRSGVFFPFLFPSRSIDVKIDISSVL